MYPFFFYSHYMIVTQVRSLYLMWVNNIMYLLESCEVFKLYLLAVCLIMHNQMRILTQVTDSSSLFIIYLLLIFIFGTVLGKVNLIFQSN